MSVGHVRGTFPAARAAHSLDRQAGIARPALVGAAFNTFLWPLLGIIFLPFTTLIYVIVYTPGVGLTGFDWFWVILALLLDIGHWGAGYTQRDQVPGRSA